MSGARPRFEIVQAALFLGFTVLLALPARVLGQSEPPPPLPLEELDFPEFQEALLDNGAEVIVVSQHEQPLVTVNLMVRAGSSSDPRNRVGVAEMTAGLLTKGTGTRSAEDISEAMDFIGGSLSASASLDWSSVSLAVMTPDLDTGLELMADVVMNPSFPEDEMEIIREQALTGLQSSLSSPGFLAGRAFTREIYGRHPYGKVDTPETIEAIRQRDLARFHRSEFKPTNALFVVAGDISADEAVERLNGAFAAWEPGPTRPPTYFAAPEREEREVILVHRPGSEQSEIRIGHLLMDGRSEGWTPLDLATEILGGGSLGTLFQVLRETRGWTYGAYAGASRRKDRGLFQVGMSVRNEVTDSALAEALRLMNEARTVPPTPRRLDEVKGSMVGSFPLQIETPQQIAGQVASYRLLGLDQEHLETYRERVAALSPEEVQAAAREHIHPGRAAVVVVGDATVIRQGLGRFGDLRMEDVEGNRIYLEDIEVRESDIAWDPGVLEPGRFVYRFSLRGEPMGEVIRQLNRRTVDGQAAMAMTESTSLPNQSIRQEVVFTTRSFRPLSGGFRAAAGGREVTTELEYGDGRITGTRTNARGETREVDQEVVRGALLGGMDELAVWISDLEGTKELRYPSANVVTGRVSQVKFEVRGTTEVTVPAGTFQAYEVDLSAGDGSQRGWFRVEAPHVLLKAEPRGQPVVIELTSMSGGGG